jgi:hypothetical protein
MNRLKTYAVVAVVFLLGGLLVLLGFLLFGDAVRHPPSDTPVAEIRADELRGEGTSAYPRQPGLSVPDQAGLAQGQELRVYGTVRDRYGDPVAEVRVVSGEPSASEALTDIEGNYEVYVVLRPRRLAGLRFLAVGYEEKRIPIRPKDIHADEERRIDVRLEPFIEKTMLSGTVRGEDGRAIPGVKVRLRSKRLKTRYVRVSDEYGRFSIPGVKIGTDYELLIRSGGAYQDYWERFLELSPDGLSIDIVLEPFVTGRLSGRMVDEDGYAVPGFSLSLRSTQASELLVQVSGDADGHFVVEEAPAGNLTFKAPGLLIRGVYLSPGSEEEVLLVLDWGDHVLSGTVVDDRGRPVAGAQLDLSWLHTRAAVRSGSIRRTRTDERGSFAFSLADTLARRGCGSSPSRGRGPSCTSEPADAVQGSARAAGILIARVFVCEQGGEADEAKGSVSWAGFGAGGSGLIVLREAACGRVRRFSSGRPEDRASFGSG